MEMRNPASMPIGQQHFAQLVSRINELEAKLARMETTTRAYYQLTEVTEPAAGPTNTARLFTVDNGVGKTSLRVRFPTGATQTISTEP